MGGRLHRWFRVSGRPTRFRATSTLYLRRNGSHPDWWDISASPVPAAILIRSPATHFDSPGPGALRLPSAIDVRCANFPPCASTSKPTISSIRRISKTGIARQALASRPVRNGSFEMKRALLVALLSAVIAGAADLPHRIVSLSPNVTEMLYGIGAFGQVVGISDYCTYPPEVKNLPSIGGWHNPSLEKLAALKPDLVISDDSQAPFIEKNVEALGLRLLVVPNHTIRDVYSGIAD